MYKEKSAVELHSQVVIEILLTNHKAVLNLWIMTKRYLLILQDNYKLLKFLSNEKKHSIGFLLKFSKYTKWFHVIFRKKMNTPSNKEKIDYKNIKWH